MIVWAWAKLTKPNMIYYLHNVQYNTWGFLMWRLSSGLSVVHRRGMNLSPDQHIFSSLCFFGELLHFLTAENKQEDTVFDVQTTTSVTVTDLMRGLNQRCHQAESKSRHRTRCSSQVFILFLFVSSTKKNSASLKLSFITLFWFKDIKKTDKKMCKNRQSVTKDSQNNYWNRTTHGFCSVWERHSTLHYTDTHSHVQHNGTRRLRHFVLYSLWTTRSIVLHTVGPPPLPYVLRSIFPSLFPRDVEVAHIRRKSGFMSSLWMCSCRYNSQKTCGFLQAQLVAWSWKVYRRPETES